MLQIKDLTFHMSSIESKEQVGHESINQLYGFLAQGGLLHSQLMIGSWEPG